MGSSTPSTAVVEEWRKMINGGNGQKRRNPNIIRFQHHIEFDPKFFDKSWRKLHDAIREICNHNCIGLSFEELYSACIIFYQHGCISLIARYLTGIEGLQAIKPRLRDQCNKKGPSNNHEMGRDFNSSSYVGDHGVHVEATMVIGEVEIEGAKWTMDNVKFSVKELE
ncbi:Cullin-3B [Zea mays]|uniref:Cullin-3B n=1 Tax=Zea mays TaxID=4577 RepID=A0A3L6DHC9_MAIZE|nr:Cullin-3B [Zea mays]